MKFLPSQIAYFLRSRTTKRNLGSLARFILFLVVMVALYTVIFHFLMAAEGQDHSWVTGFYWTLTVMSTLGFGDITFHSDLGRAFSILVLVSGVVFLLVVLPFTFIEFFYEPWLTAQSHRRAPREVPADVSGHVLLTHYDPVTLSLIERLRSHGRHYYVLEPDLSRALELYDEGVRVVLGERDNIETYQQMRAADAALVVATGDDYVNTNIAFTVRELSEDVPIAALARREDSVDVLELAGSSHVVHLPDMLGRALARRALGGDVRANVIGRFGELLIVEAPITGTPWVGRTLATSQLREATGLTVVGLWERGRFETPHPQAVLGPSTVLVMAGSEEALGRFAEFTTIYNVSGSAVLIIGGGRVGRAAAQELGERGIPYRILEKNPEQIRDPALYVRGDAADRACLEEAGIEKAPTVIVTTNDDPMNIYLTIYCRKLRPDLQIISRTTLERNISTLHRAGADFVMSYASMGANAIYNVLEGGDVVMLAEGLDVFRHEVPPELVGITVAQSGIREQTGCSVVAIEVEAQTRISPPPDFVLPEGAELILIGTTAGEHQFLERYSRRNAGS